MTTNLIEAHAFYDPNSTGACTSYNHEQQAPCGWAESDHERAHKSLGVTEYMHVVKATAQLHSAPLEGNVTLLVHGVKMLTESRRLKIGEWLWVQSDRPLDAWLAAGEVAQLNWTRSHMGKYTYINVEYFTDDQVDHWSLDYTSGGHKTSMFEIASLEEIDAGRP